MGIDIERTPDRFDLAAVAEFGVASLEDFVALEAASKATACAYEGSVATRCHDSASRPRRTTTSPRWRRRATTWNVELHMRSPLEHWIGAMDPSLREQEPTGTVA